MRVTRAQNWRQESADPSGTSPLDLVRDPSRAAALLYHPLRLRILACLLEPDSAAGVARRLKLPRQTVNYHVRELAHAHFLSRAGRRRRRRLYEQCYVATARAYVLSPELLGQLVPDPARIPDTSSAKYLLGLASQVQSELARSADLAAAAGKPLSTLSMNIELRFTSPVHRAAFMETLQRAILENANLNNAPFANSDNSSSAGRPYRLVLGCYPIPTDSEQKAETLPATSALEKKS